MSACDLPDLGPNVAVVAHSAGDLRVEDVPEPTPGPGEAVVSVAYGGICGSDLHYWTHGAAGLSILREPMVLGHEMSGTVLVAAEDGSGPAAGTPVTVHPATHDSYLGSAALLPHTPGVFARRVALPASMLRPLPASVPLRTAALCEPAAVAWHGLARAGDVRDRRVLVVGCGPIGALSVAAARALGAAEVVAVDLHHLPRRIARDLGASTTLAADDPAITELDVDVALECSGSRPGLASAIRGTRRGGRVVMVGLQPAGEQPTLLADAITRELELVGSFRFRDEIDDVVTALGAGLALDAAITHEVDVTDTAAVLDAFGTARDASVSGKVLLRF